jgi:hypothetical protein
LEVDVAAGLAFVQASNAGPAGTAALLLGDGIELDVDVAQPTRLVGLTLDLPAGGPGALDHETRLRLDALLGRPRVDHLLDLARSATHDSDPERKLGRHGAPLRDRATGSGHRLAPALHRAALAYTAASEAGAPPVVHASGRLEAALELAKASSIAGLRPVARRDARLAIDLLLDLAEERRLTIPEHAAAAVSDLVRAARALDGRRDKRAALRALLHEIERGDFTPTRPRVGSMVPSRSMAPSGATPGRISMAREAGRGGGPRVDVRALPGALADAAPIAHRRSAAEVEVRIPDWAEQQSDLWARAFHARDDVLLAVAQFRRDGPDVRARLLVPPSHTPHLEVDVTDRPELARPSAALCAVQRATYQGRLAARSERLGRAGEAARHWSESAREWVRAGDPSRAQQAALYGREPNSEPWPPDRVIAALVSDLLDSTPS